MHICQSPIGLAGGNHTLYGYVHDTNAWLDVFGLSETCHDDEKGKALQKSQDALDKQI